MFMRNWLRSSNTLRRPVSMNASNRAVNWFMRLRRSSKPKLIEGSWSAMDGASCDEARIVVLRDGSKVVMLKASSDLILRCSVLLLLYALCVCDVVCNSGRECLRWLLG
jgi:hypothetical protein